MVEIRGIEFPKEWVEWNQRDDITPPNVFLTLRDGVHKKEYEEMKKFFRPHCVRVDGEEKNIGRNFFLKHIFPYDLMGVLVSLDEELFEHIKAIALFNSSDLDLPKHFGNWIDGHGWISHEELEATG